MQLLRTVTRLYKEQEKSRKELQEGYEAESCSI